MDIDNLPVVPGRTIVKIHDGMVKIFVGEEDAEEPDFILVFSAVDAMTVAKKIATAATMLGKLEARRLN